MFEFTHARLQNFNIYRLCLEILYCSGLATTLSPTSAAFSCLALPCLSNHKSTTSMLTRKVKFGMQGYFIPTKINMNKNNLCQPSLNKTEHFCENRFSLLGHLFNCENTRVTLLFRAERVLTALPQAFQAESSGQY